jgi:hypothetical protein
MRLSPSSAIEKTKLTSAALFDWRDHQHRHCSSQVREPGDVHHGSIALRLPVRNSD